MATKPMVSAREKKLMEAYRKKIRAEEAKKIAASGKAKIAKARSSHQADRAQEQFTRGQKLRKARKRLSSVATSSNYQAPAKAAKGKPTKRRPITKSSRKMSALKKRKCKCPQ